VPVEQAGGGDESDRVGGVIAIDVHGEKCYRCMRMGSTT
jgi:hypothetical protein